MQLHEIFLNGAYVTLLASLAVRDLLRLRLMMAIATLCFIAFAILVDNTSMKLWNFIFAGLNICQAARIIRERRPRSLSSGHVEVCANRFPSVSKQDLLKSWNFGRSSQDIRSKSQARA